MATYPKPEQFDGGKFAVRYGLNPRANDFWDDGRGNIVLRDGLILPDDPPIFEAPDPRPIRKTKEELRQLNGQCAGPCGQVIAELIERIQE